MQSVLRSLPASTARCWRTFATSATCNSSACLFYSPTDPNVFRRKFATESLKAKLNKQLAESMKAKDAATVSVIRGINSKITYKAKEKGSDVPDDDILKIMLEMLKESEENLQLMKSHQRKDLAEKEAHAIAVIKQYLPDPAPIRERMSALVRDLGVQSPKDMKKLMEALPTRFTGAELAVARAMVKEVVPAQPGR